MKTLLKKIKETLTVILIVAGISFLLFGIFWVDYKIWRAEHPQAKTWTFFIHSSR